MSRRHGVLLDSGHHTDRSHSVRDSRDRECLHSARRRGGTTRRAGCAHDDFFALRALLARRHAGRAPVRQARLSESVRSCSSLRSRPARMHAVVDYIPLAMSSQVRDNMARFSTSRYVPAMVVPTLARRAASVASSKIRMRERARYNAPERASRYRSIHAWHYAPERARYRSIHA